METSNLELAIEMLKKSVDFRCQQIDFIIKDKYLIIWSINATGTFHNVNLCMLFNQLFSSFIAYNSDEKRVELTVYSIFDFA